MKSQKVKITERGWPGHFCCSGRCHFRRHTLLEFDGEKLIVSTVGRLMSLYGSEYETIGSGRYYETMAFFSDLDDTRFYDADCSKQIDFESPWAIYELDAEDEANKMHDAVVEELADDLIKGLRR